MTGFTFWAGAVSAEATLHTLSSMARSRSRETHFFILIFLSLIAETPMNPRNLFLSPIRLTL
jgi:hypothetical protein